MIVLYTDFGVADPYIGQMHAVLAREAPKQRVIDLLHSAPNYDIRASAYLLPALASGFPAKTVFVCVVDPGVGGERAPVMLEADDRWYVGPDNGLFHLVERRARRRKSSVIEWRPETLSKSFHGRDLFAPVAAKLASGKKPKGIPGNLTAPAGHWPDDLPAIIYIDHYGNAMTGLRAATVDRQAALAIAGRQLHYAPVYSAVTPGMPFWYENSIGLVEVAMNQGNAAAILALKVGTELEVLS